ncbi:MAG: hypothetical protein CM15mV36_1370 [Caudoviricetes sp.]|nr:MAG: hypothetical protein CM15mV36_1370 [Caudoviricetes sp.]
MTLISTLHIVTSTTKTESAIDYENPWVYDGRPFTSDDINDYYGFVYSIINTLSGKRYIGRKYFWQHRTPKGKKRKVKSESDWKKYYGSSKELIEDKKKFGAMAFKRTIISIHNTKGLVNFNETKQLFLNNVLTEAMEDGSPAYYNSNILGRYMRKDYFNT